MGPSSIYAEHATACNVYVQKGQKKTERHKPQTRKLLYLIRQESHIDTFAYLAYASCRFTLPFLAIPATSDKQVLQSR